MSTALPWGSPSPSYEVCTAPAPAHTQHLTKPISPCHRIPLPFESSHSHLAFNKAVMCLLSSTATWGHSKRFFYQLQTPLKGSMSAAYLNYNRHVLGEQGCGEIHAYIWGFVVCFVVVFLKRKATFNGRKNWFNHIKCYKQKSEVRSRVEMQTITSIIQNRLFIYSKKLQKWLGLIVIKTFWYL